MWNILVFAPFPPTAVHGLQAGFKIVIGVFTLVLANGSSNYDIAIVVFTLVSTNGSSWSPGWFQDCNWRLYISFSQWQFKL